MLRCVLQRANNLRHSDPLASVTFRGKRMMGASEGRLADRLEYNILNSGIVADYFDLVH